MRKGGAFVLLFLVAYVVMAQVNKGKKSTVSNPNKPDDFNYNLVALDENIPEEH